MQILFAHRLSNLPRRDLGQTRIQGESLHGEDQVEHGLRAASGPTSSVLLVGKRDQRLWVCLGGHSVGRRIHDEEDPWRLSLVP